MCAQYCFSLSLSLSLSFSLFLSLSLRVCVCVLISISLTRLYPIQRAKKWQKWTLLLSFLLKWLGNYIRTSWSWNKWGNHQNCINILSIKHTFTVMSVSWFLLYTCMKYFRMQWPMMMCMWTSLEKNGLCWILHRGISTKMWCWRSIGTSKL